MAESPFVMNEREKLIEMITSQQVVNAELYNPLCQNAPLLSKMMLDKFKAFLNDNYFTDIERQTMLMTFFEKQTNLEIIREILKYIQTCDLKDDYTKIIMEWSYHNSEDIVKQNLAKVDGSKLYDLKPKQDKLEKPVDLTEDFIQNLLDLTAELLDNGGEEE